MLRAHPKPKQVDTWGERYPTLVDDVARCVSLIVDAKAADKASVCGILHCSSPERTTKYEQALLCAELLGLPADHLSPDDNPPPGAPRPKNTQLSCEATWAALGAKVDFVPLRQGFATALAPFKASFGAGAAE